MTEKEAKLILNVRISRFDHAEDVNMALEIAKTALEEIQQYREIETELKEKYHANVDVKELIKYFMETIFEGEKHDRFCILTNKEAKMWEGYQSIGTVEEIEHYVRLGEKLNLCDLVRENARLEKNNYEKLAELHNTALEYDTGIQTTTDTIAEYRVKMFNKKDSRILKSIIPLLDTLIYEANQYKDWLEELEEG